MIPSTRTAALPPQPFPFFGCWATGGLAPGFGFLGGRGEGPGFAATGAAFGGAAAGLGAGGGGGGGGGGGAAAALGGGGDIVINSITRVLPPFSTPTESSVGSNTVETSPNRTVAPGASGASPFT